MSDTKLYVKTINGVEVIKPANEITIDFGDRIMFNPYEDQILSDGWVEYISPAPAIEELLSDAKEKMIDTILEYDYSENVNLFYVMEQPMWLNKETRVGLRLRFESELECGLETTTLWFDGNAFTLPINDAIKMLHAIEMYASVCYDNTQRHIGVVRRLETLEDVENYDYTLGYPEKLHFNYN